MPYDYNAETGISTLDDSFEQGASRMLDILRGLKPVYWQEVMPNLISTTPYALAVPHDHSALVAKGNTALVFALPNIFEEWDWKARCGLNPVYLVGKSSFYDEAVEGQFNLSGRPSGLEAGGLELTVASLLEMGFDVPRMEEYRRETQGRWMYFTIMPDLRGNGGFKVAAAEDFDFSQLVNGGELKQNYDLHCKDILGGIESGRYALRVEGHRSNEGPMTAIRHIFLVQYALHGVGRLVPADLNHLTIRAAQKPE